MKIEISSINKTKSSSEGIKVAFTSDIHFNNITGEEDMIHFMDNISSLGIPYLFVAGDLVSRGTEHRDFNRFTEIICGYPVIIYYTPGNHDLWVKEGDSYKVLTQILPHISQKTNLKLLDGSPVIINQTGFVGTVGWYDYDFRRVPHEYPELFRDCLFRFNGDEKPLMWEDINIEHYRNK